MLTRDDYRDFMAQDDISDALFERLDMEGEFESLSDFATAYTYKGIRGVGITYSDAVYSMFTKLLAPFEREDIPLGVEYGSEY
jgi:hypothetical protein